MSQHQLAANRDLVYKEAQFYMIAVAVRSLTLAFAAIYRPAPASGDAIQGETTRWLALMPLALYGLYVFVQSQDTPDHHGEVDTRNIRPGAEWASLALALGVILVGVEGLVRSRLECVVLLVLYGVRRLDRVGELRHGGLGAEPAAGHHCHQTLIRERSPLYPQEPPMSETTADIARFRRHDERTSVYDLVIVTDEDKATQTVLDNGEIAWQATIRYDRLYRESDPATGAPRFHFEEIPPEQGGEHRLTSLIAEGQRGAEFSELVRFGRHLLAFDDRTGLVCEVREGHHVIPRQILMTGSGDERFKGFKSEWATVQGNHLVVGSHGKSREEEWIKRLDRHYGIDSVDWHEPYRRMREALGVDTADGYVVHEAGEWHPLRERWLFFPRKISREAFDPARDDRECGDNRLLIADASFRDIQVMEVGERRPERGVSSIKLLPGRENELIGLKSVEIGDHTETYLFCFDLEGRILHDDVYVGPYKCEGVEIL